MRHFKATLIAALAVCLLGPVASAAGVSADNDGEISVELTHPDKPCYVECALVSGGITVMAYEGKEVKVQARKRETEEWVDWDDDEEEEEAMSRQGLKKIPVSSSAFEVEEDDNNVIISAESWMSPIDIVIKVPTRTSLGLTTINAGDIEVSGVTGEIEAENINGDIVLAGISGSVVAYVQNGELEAEMKSVTPGKAMSFASFNGDVDVTLPASVKATVRLSTHTGDAYTDFDIKAIKMPAEVIEENEDAGEGRYSVRIEDAFYGNINGGGPDYDFSTFNGDIFIRKGK
ncbi:MAG: DUF4097 family beta strand repeat-containing protein [bacterium]|jgi:hypothetical protein